MLYQYTSILHVNLKSRLHRCGMFISKGPRTEGLCPFPIMMKRQCSQGNQLAPTVSSLNIQHHYETPVNNAWSRLERRSPLARAAIHIHLGEQIFVITREHSSS